MPNIHGPSFFKEAQIMESGGGQRIQEDEEIDLSEISILYSTDKTEDERTTFEDTYKEKSLDEATQGAQFLQGLIDNKDELQEKLGLTDEQYDSLACVALALASQETGMGYEDGYKSENTGIGGFFRKIAKWADVNIFGGASASSGLTQMKIYDFLNSDTLSQEQKDILKEYGIEAKGVATNNLYANPDKAAIATMVVLTSIVENYDDYEKVLSDAHSEIASSLNDGLTEEERIEKGNEILNDISTLYQNLDDSQKMQVRSSIKNWLLSSNGTTIKDGGDKKYNEEYQLQQLNKLLESYSADFSLSQSDLDYIRYALTSDGQEMNVTEYCAYGWNKGTGTTGMQLDRLLADKMGIILSNPEDFDYDQFTVNVSSLAQKYAQQSLDTDVMLYVNGNFEL